jgi:AraC family transcriptional regulator, regulatory protein of adaptative response / DNA-3-methyladenine glycosylase II
MQLERQACYRILRARDARYDGRFFTCVKTTGIYCRPICPARPPKLENCVFVPSAAAAQEAGFRPCLRCRPECSPELGAWRGSSASVSRALALIERGALDQGDVDALAARLGLGARQLRRLFQQHLGASPISVAQTRRVHLAKQLIHDSQLSMTEVALASGFSSLRRFNETFKSMFGRPPSELRRRRSVSLSAPGSSIEVLLPYRAPYDFPLMLAFLRARAIPGVEHVTADSYARVIAVDGAIGSLSVSNCAERSSLRVQVRLGRVVALPAIIARVRQMFDLGADPQCIAEELGRDPVLGPLVAARPGLRVPGAWDGFEIAVRAVLGQQITVRAATRLAGELVNLLAEPVAPDLLAPGLRHAFPPAQRFRGALLAKLPMPRARAATLAAVAEAQLADPALFDAARDLDQAVARLVKLPGIGVWSAQYIAMRALSHSDAFPAADIGLQRAMAENGVRPSAKALLARAESWRPWRSYAVLHLWTADAAHERAKIALTAGDRPEQTARRPVRKQTVRERTAPRSKENLDALAS